MKDCATRLADPTNLMGVQGAMGVQDASVHRQAAKTNTMSQAGNRPAPSRLGKLSLAGAIALAATLLPLTRTIAASVNFPQSSQAVSPTPADSRKLDADFTPPFKPGPMPPPVSEILLRSAPAELTNACAAMVDSWGAAARGTARVTLRILAVANGNAWIAYRCDSRRPQFANSYSERLAAFNAARGTIQFIDLARCRRYARDALSRGARQHAQAARRG